MKEGSQQTIFDSMPDSSLHEYKLSVDELKEELSKFDLTPNQSKVYIFLGKYGSKTASEVCRALKIARTETYQLLSSLQKKGIVLATFGHPIKFSAIPLNKAVQTLVNSEKERVKSLEKKEQTIIKLWDSIPDFLKEKPGEEENKFQMLQGTNQINAKLKEMISKTGEEIKILGSEKDFLRLYHSDFLDTLKEKKLNSKIVTSCSEKTLYIFENMNKKQIRCMPSSIKDELCFVMKGNNEMMFFTKKDEKSVQNTTAMWTDSSSLVYSMKLLFDFIWSSSKTRE
ncbi:MAG: Transcriptional regulator TrmB [Nitrosopumilales archaeon]|jgi:sugar-specific transcriptional regulator TrmB|nr:MAG: Transcriptional regulator TrmB [Nitrosopumilales archaeon]